MSVNEALLTATLKNLTVIPTGHEYPDNACTQFVIMNGRAFFNLNGEGFITAPADFSRRFAPTYRVTYDDCRWNVCHDIHGQTADMADYIDNIHRISLTGINAIAALLQDNDISRRQVGELFKRYTSKADRALIEKACQQQPARRSEPAAYTIGA